MLEGRHIAVVEDDSIMGASIVQRLELEGARVAWHRTMARALPAIRTPHRPLDVVICDIRLRDGSGEDLFMTLLHTASPPPFLFITGQGDVAQAVRLLRAGAADYITKPFEMRTFLERVAFLAAPREDSQIPAQTGISDLARKVDRQAIEVAGLDAPVLIRGQPGLGKARLARHIHALSDRMAAPVVQHDLLRESLDPEALEALADRAGEGSLVLLGIGRLSAAAQAGLQDMLRHGRCRVIATAGLGLETRAAHGGFRTDLLNTLRAHEIIIPPLAQRPEDAVWLAVRLLAMLDGGRRTGLSVAAEAAIRAHDWPGNGRELRSRIVRALATEHAELLQPFHIFPERVGQGVMRPLNEVRDAAERAHIAATLAATGGHVGEAARALGISRTTLWEKMQRLGL